MVYRDVKETLNLSCVKVCSDYAVNPSVNKNISDELCRDGFAGLGLPVLAGITEVRNNCVDVMSTCPLHCVCHDEQLHNVFVHWCACRLNDEHVSSSNAIVQGHSQLPVSKPVVLEV